MFLFHVSHSLTSSVLILLELFELMPQLLDLQALFRNLRVLRLFRLLKFTQLIVKAGKLSPFIIKMSLGNVVGVLWLLATTKSI